MTILTATWFPEKSSPREASFQMKSKQIPVEEPIPRVPHLRYSCLCAPLRQRWGNPRSKGPWPGQEALQHAFHRTVSRETLKKERGQWDQTGDDASRFLQNDSPFLQGILTVIHSLRRCSLLGGDWTQRWCIFGVLLDALLPVALQLCNQPVLSTVLSSAREEITEAFCPLYIQGGNWLLML